MCQKPGGIFDRRHPRLLIAFMARPDSVIGELVFPAPGQVRIAFDNTSCFPNCFAATSHYNLYGKRITSFSSLQFVSLGPQEESRTLTFQVILRPLTPTSTL